MKKTRLMVLTLAVAIMMMGAGYAYWNDTLVINNTVETGKLNVEFTDAKLTAEDKIISVDKVETPEEGKGIKGLEFTIENLYPGASVNYGFTIKNTGTLPALVKDVNIKFGENEALAKKIMVTGTVNYNGKKWLDVPENTTMEIFNKAKMLERITEEFNKGDSLELDLVLTLDKDLTGDVLENNTLKTQTSIEFTQHNDPRN